MKNILMLLISTLMIFGTACKSNKDAGKSNEVEKNESMNEKNIQKYPLLLSFISIGTGVDYKAKEMLDVYIGEFNKGYNKEISFETRQWGREGEYDLLFNLDNLDAEQKEKFISDIRNLFSSNELVKIKLDSSPEH
ncbi:MAG TPA: hypothetical protein PKH65_02155 [Bacteroidia bacterium]|nr:hypothetical protein [Bacteroidia bacterium]HNT79458.1 hypothetical protein [Bacteroidia bacterium]